MSKQIRVQREEVNQTEEASEVNPQVTSDNQLADLDAVLADIDVVLDEEAQALARGYVQQGGQ